MGRGKTLYGDREAFRRTTERVRATSLSDISHNPGCHPVLRDTVVDTFTQQTSVFRSCPCTNMGAVIHVSGC